MVYTTKVTTGGEISRNNCFRSGFKLLQKNRWPYS
jgi:hypothetical protein